MKENRPDLKKGGKKDGRDRKHGAAYTAEAFVIIVVLAAALMIPQIIFQVQDRILCSDIKLGQRESMNVEALGTTYEQSLQNRMQNFAEGLANLESFYVTSQNLSPDETLNSFLYSDVGLNNPLLMNFVYGNLIPIEIWDDYYTITQWKQYVIYSDNYAKGVNFILWYIEMEDGDGAKFKLLADAEDGTLYGVKTEGSYLSGVPLGYMNLQEALRYGGSAVNVWTYYALYYRATIAEMKDFLFWAGKMGIDTTGIEVDASYTGVEISRKEAAEAERQVQRMVRYQCETKESARFLLPYGETELDAILSIEERYFDKEYLFPDITIGIRQIYEMIPEFA
ncbi:MAG: hypothetical protein HFH85_05665 [Lachnospiraceae bacterium]|jgi:hypothetical protein|nr:hypothetical protein [Lachnospiraceae bacterium]